MRLCFVTFALLMGSVANAQNSGPSNQDIMDLYWGYWQAFHVKPKDNVTIFVDGNRYRVVPEFGKVWEFATPERTLCETVGTDDRFGTKWECTFMRRVRDTQTHDGGSGRRLIEAEIVEKLNEQEFRENRQSMVVYGDDGNYFIPSADADSSAFAPSDTLINHGFAVPSHPYCDVLHGVDNPNSTTAVVRATPCHLMPERRDSYSYPVNCSSVEISGDLKVRTLERLFEAVIKDGGVGPLFAFVACSEN